MRAPRSYQLLMRLLDRPRPVARVTLIVFVMCLPALANGLNMDDYMIESKVKRDLWGAFEFLPRDPAARASAIREASDAGLSPWWVEQNRQTAYLRPLASLTHAIDFRYWPKAVWLMHLENIALFLFGLWLVGQIYIELGLSQPVVALATFFFAMSSNLAMSVGWLSGRNTLLAGGFGVAAIWLHVRAHEGSARSSLQLMAAVALALAVFSAEFGAGAAGFLLAHALIFGTGGVVRRVLSCWPYAIVLAIWQAIYIGAGYGSVGSGFYQTPFRDPWPFLRGVVTGLPIYISTQLSAPIATFCAFYPHALLGVTAISLVLLFLKRGMLVPLLRTDPRARFLLLGAALSTLPLATTIPQDRLVFFVSLGTSACVALIVTERLDPANRTRSRFGAKSLFRIHALWLPAIFIPMLSALNYAKAAGGDTNAIAAALPEAGDRGVVLLNCPSDLLMWFQPFIREHRGLAPLPSLDLLYSGAQSVVVSRTSDRSLDVATERGWFGSTLERAQRDPDRHAILLHDVVELPRFRVTVLAVDAGSPTRVRYDFTAPLETLPLEWLAYQGAKPEPWPLPPVGSRVTLPALPPFP